MESISLKFSDRWLVLILHRIFCRTKHDLIQQKRDVPIAMKMQSTMIQPASRSIMFYFHRKNQMVIIPHFIECRASHCLQVKQDSDCPLFLTAVKRNVLPRNRAAQPGGVPKAGFYQSQSEYQRRYTYLRIIGLILTFFYAVASLTWITYDIVICFDKEVGNPLASNLRPKKPKNKSYTKTINFRQPSSGKCAGQSQRSFMWQ